MRLLKPYKHCTIYIGQSYNKLIVQSEEDGKIDSLDMQGATSIISVHRTKRFIDNEMPRSEWHITTMYYGTSSRPSKEDHWIT